MSLEMYQHDGETTFRFVLRGELAGAGCDELEHAWTTAKSILGGKQLVVDISGLDKADQSGIELLSRMSRESGARVQPALPAACGEPTWATSAERSKGTAFERFLRRWSARSITPSTGAAHCATGPDSGGQQRRL